MVIHELSPQSERDKQRRKEKQEHRDLNASRPLSEENTFYETKKESIVATFTTLLHPTFFRDIFHHAQR